ncbi:MAG: hypothetical protein MMC33_001397 [Icmadophila ericetorum]|nr:hypothetical protein [Icmadophila ericetorum]
MPTELEELVEFLHHGNTQIRQIAAENLVPYSEKEPGIFKANKLEPVKDLKLLIKDYAPIAKNALIILINISNDKDALSAIAEDDAFLESLLLRITNAKEPNANEMAMLLANMAKSDSIERLLTLKRDPPLGLSTSKIAIDQLMDCFVKGAKGSYNPKANYDYLAYLFADLAKFPKVQEYLTTPQPYDSIYPLTKLLPFTAFPSTSQVRRLGVASTLKNTAFYLSSHTLLLSPSSMNVLPYILLPLSDGKFDTYTDTEIDQLLEELQYLDPCHRRETDTAVLKTHLETLLLLTSSREGRDVLRGSGVYFVVRECHLGVEEEGVREGAERLVQVLMRDEEGEEKGTEGKGMKALEHRKKGGRGRDEEPAGRMVTQADLKEDSDNDDDDDKVVEIF